MTIKKRMTPEEWAEIRARWEDDPRDGYTWIVSELNLKVTHVAVLKRAKNEGWAKKASLKNIVERAQKRADEKVTGKVTGKVNAVTSEESVDLRANVIEKHRNEWGEHGTTFPISNMLGENALGIARVAKTVAEAIKIRQDGERRAWGLDANGENTSAGMATLDELDALFEQAIKRTDEMKTAVRAERETGGNEAN